MCILAVTYPCLLFTGYFDYKDPEAHYNTGWFVISIVLLNITVNIIAVMYQTIKALAGVIRKAWAAWQRKRAADKSQVVPISGDTDHTIRQDMTEVIPLEVGE